MKLKKNSRARVVGFSSFFSMLAVLGTAFACPSLEPQASATNLSIDFSLSSVQAALLQIDFYLNNTGAGVSQMSQLLTIDFFLENGNPNYAAIFKLLGIDFVLRNNMAIDLYNLADTVTPTDDIQPLPNGQFVRGSTSFSVYTSDTQSGFAVYVGSTDDETDMVATDSTGRIPTLTDAVDGSTNSFGTSAAWGYKLAASETDSGADNGANNENEVGMYRGLKTEKSIAYKHNGHGDIAFDLTFGAQLTKSTEAGTYERGVELTAVTPATSAVAINEAFTMADKYIARTFELRPELKAEVEARKAAAEEAKNGTFETMNEIINIMNEEKYSQE